MTEHLTCVFSGTGTEWSKILIPIQNYRFLENGSEVPSKRTFRVNCRILVCMKRSINERPLFSPPSHVVHRQTLGSLELNCPLPHSLGLHHLSISFARLVKEGLSLCIDKTVYHSYFNTYVLIGQESTNHNVSPRNSIRHCLGNARHVRN